MNSLINFDYQEKPIRVITDEEGAPWWVARDVCDILGIKNHRDTLAKCLDEDEKGVEKASTLGGDQDVLVVSESGLYTLIIRSNKPAAKPFRKWITSEVLPSLRKTGQYTMPGVDVPLSAGDEVISVQRLSEVAQGIKAAMIMARAFGFRDYEARTMANKLVKKITGIDAIELLEIPEPVQVEQGGLYKKFVDECCETVQGAKIGATELYNRFVEWCNMNGYVPGSQKLFGMHLQKLITRFFNGRTVVYMDVAIK